ncbi:hypothetical protein D3C78_1902490 [compost metagenome]
MIHVRSAIADHQFAGVIDAGLDGFCGGFIRLNEGADAGNASSDSQGGDEGFAVHG